MMVTADGLKLNTCEKSKMQTKKPIFERKNCQSMNLFNI